MHVGIHVHARLSCFSCIPSQFIATLGPASMFHNLQTNVSLQTLSTCPYKHGGLYSNVYIFIGDYWKQKNDKC